MLKFPFQHRSVHSLGGKLFAIKLKFPFQHRSVHSLGGNLFAIKLKFPFQHRYVHSLGGKLFAIKLKFPVQHRSVHSLGGKFKRTEEFTYESYQCRPDISLSIRCTNRICNCWRGRGADPEGIYNLCVIFNIYVLKIMSWVQLLTQYCLQLHLYTNITTCSMTLS